jgi:hypothetical protein
VPPAVAEAEARQLLRGCGGFGSLEAWIAVRRWKETPGGWTVTAEPQDWRFQLEVVPEGLRVTAAEPRTGGPAGWVVRLL